MAEPAPEPVLEPEGSDDDGDDDAEEVEVEDDDVVPLEVQAILDDWRKDTERVT
eukprot:SAG31_NODE_1661_length_7596_cov_4.503802_8_plen_54_part_00